ncbi:hypothetical protein C0992_004598, partial [Termitomyces sp. T32_za158]
YTMKIVSENVSQFGELDFITKIPIYVCGEDVINGVTKTDLYVPVKAENKRWQDAVTGKSQKVTVEKADEDRQDKVKGASHPRLDGSWKCGKSWQRVVQRFFHRFISGITGKPLKTFTSSKHLLPVVSHAFISKFGHTFLNL